MSQEIRTNLKWQEEGWGRMKAQARIDQLEWDTAIWYDSKRETYLLPLKANIRQKLKLKIDQQLTISICI